MTNPPRPYTVQRGYSLIQLLVVMLLVSIVATAAFTA
ncbi:TPA: prepilin-type N-terminal cleavage/methylation domain-containing protein [Neisseria subflava]